MNRTDWFLAWFLGSAAAGYGATILAMLGSSRAVPAALAAYILFYVGHFNFKRDRDSPILSPVGLASVATRIEQSRFVVSAILGAMSAAAIVLFFVRSQVRSEYPAHTGLLIAPFAYFSYACAKLIASRR